MTDQRRESDSDNPCVGRTGHPPVAVQSRSARKFLESENSEQGDADNGWSPPGEDHRHSNWSEHEPRPVCAPDRTEVFFRDQLDQAEDKPAHGQRAENDPDVGAENRIVERLVRRHLSYFAPYFGFLVPKLCLGTHLSSQLCCSAIITPTVAQRWPGSKKRLQRRIAGGPGVPNHMRSQTEFGNEGSCSACCGDINDQQTLPSTLP